MFYRLVVTMMRLVPESRPEPSRWLAYRRTRACSELSSEAGAIALTRLTGWQFSAESALLRRLGGRTVLGETPSGIGAKAFFEMLSRWASSLRSRMVAIRLLTATSTKAVLHGCQESVLQHNV